MDVEQEAMQKFLESNGLLAKNDYYPNGPEEYIKQRHRYSMSNSKHNLHSSTFSLPWDMLPMLAEGAATGGKVLGPAHQKEMEWPFNCPDAICSRNVLGHVVIAHM